MDRVPIVGWWGLRREASLHGRGFWVRPLLIEVAMGVGFALLYWYEVQQAAMVTVLPGTMDPGSVPVPPDSWTLHVQYVGHIILFSLMMVATFIDFDEQTIPDEITLPGVLMGLTLAAAFPTSRPIIVSRAFGGWAAEHLSPVSECRPLDWSVWLGTPGALAIGVACFLAWCVAVVPWLWTLRRGLAKAFQFLAASFLRRLSWLMIGIAVVGTVAICLVWAFGNPTIPGNVPKQLATHRWESLFSALIGMAAGGGLIWAVRIIGSHTLGQEAMGFGDVTLMAMIGAFTGWQATLLIFFLAPFCAVFIAVTQWLFTGRRDIAFGPYLCLATCVLVVKWEALWQVTGHLFSMGTLVPAILLVGLALMGVMLLGMRWLRETFGGAAT